jgi:drug/metabolite transporter (DMT)-like permease
MTAGLYGLIAALCWGSADFIARFTGRSIGHQQTIFGMIAVGTIALSLVFWWLELEIIPDFSRLWLLVISGVGIMYSTMLLYKALAMGPVTIVSPIVGSFPVFNVILAIILGARPDMVQWAAVISVLGGVWIVSYAADHFLHEIHYNEKLLRQAVLVALSASLGLGISVAASQEAARHYGELQTICASRWIGLITISLYFVYKKVLPRAVLTCAIAHDAGTARHHGVCSPDAGRTYQCAGDGCCHLVRLLRSYHYTRQDYSQGAHEIHALGGCNFYCQWGIGTFGDDLIVTP